MLDPDIAALLAYHRERHAETDFETDPQQLAGALGYGYALDSHSYLGPNGTVYVARSGDPRTRASDTGHELSHALAREADPLMPGLTHEAIIRHYHASATNIDAHVESLACHGGDALLMPDSMVRAVLARSGLTAQAVWELYLMSSALLPDALRRIVYHDPDARLAGFIAYSGTVRHAESCRCWLPFWIGDRLPELDPAVSLCQIPTRRNAVIGLIVAES